MLNLRRQEYLQQRQTLKTPHRPLKMPDDCEDAELDEEQYAVHRMQPCCISAFCVMCRQHRDRS